MQRLGPAKHGSHRLDRGPNHVVVGILLGERPARSLTVGAQHQALRALGAKPLHDPAPEQTCSTQLGNLEIKIHPDRPEEAQAAGKIIDVQTLSERCLHVLLTIGQGERQLKRLIGTGLLHVIAADRNRVELRHVLGRVLDDIADDAHARFGRIDVGVADHELLQNVVLNSPTERRLINALFLRCHHITREHGQYGAIHGHRHAHPIERNPVEEDFHIFDRIDGHPRLADIADDPWMIAVIAAMGGQIKRHADALPACGERVAIKAIAVFSG